MLHGIWRGNLGETAIPAIKPSASEDSSIDVIQNALYIIQ
jgi:hypothetical protein